MCDTMACITKNNRVFFGKNSDRNPLEPQMLTIERGDTEIHKHTIPLLLDKYVPQLLLLTQVHEKFDNPYTALLSRPAWMWGAEMGVNEHGLAIGNEAVFSRSKVDSKGLLGMDIVRLALHNAKTASQSVDLIVNLIETYGQGGDGAYRGSLRYHNSFL
ncbi:MAG: carcinine hydrolase/isopenicillin-N N-acyltransferase family protein, partial [Sphaerochaetaceae bacterium]